MFVVNTHAKCCRESTLADPQINGWMRDFDLRAWYEGTEGGVEHRNVRGLCFWQPHQKQTECTLESVGSSVWIWNQHPADMLLGAMEYRENVCQMNIAGAWMNTDESGKKKMQSRVLIGFTVTVNRQLVSFISFKYAYPFSVVIYYAATISFLYAYISYLFVYKTSSLYLWYFLFLCVSWLCQCTQHHSLYCGTWISIPLACDMNWHV